MQVWALMWHSTQYAWSMSREVRKAGINKPRGTCRLGSDMAPCRHTAGAWRGLGQAPDSSGTGKGGVPSLIRQNRRTMQAHGGRLARAGAGAGQQRLGPAPGGQVQQEEVVHAHAAPRLAAKDHQAAALGVQAAACQRARAGACEQARSADVHASMLHVLGLKWAASWAQVG
jgi:hypothetical protein